jgi:hypothetical protein
MAREDLPAAVAAIRAAPADWLALPQHGSLREWVLEDGPVEGPRPVVASGPTRWARAE